MNKPTTPDEILNQIIRFLLSPRATESDAEWMVSLLVPDPELTKFFRAEVLAALDRKATKGGKLDAVKRRKIYYALGGVARAIFAVEYEPIKRRIDAESKAARAKINANAKLGT